MAEKQKPDVVINLEQNNRPYQIIATLLLCGAIRLWQIHRFLA